MTETIEARIAKLEADVAGLSAALRGQAPTMLSTAQMLQRVEGSSLIREPSSAEKYRDRSMVVICPTRGTFAWRFADAVEHLAWPMNTRRNGPLYAVGYEVGHAYNALVQFVLDHPVLCRSRYIVTLEDDNLPQWDAIIRLVESIEEGPWDAVSGLYYTKDDYHAPMAYGDPDEFRRTGRPHFRPLDLTKVPRDQRVVETLGIACGCGVWKMDMFRDVKAPWFATVEEHILHDGNLLTPAEADVLIEKDPSLEFQKHVTQDIYFCSRAIRQGKRFAVDTSVVVGHLDVASGRVY